MVQHPIGDDAVERAVRERQLLRVADAGVDAAGARQLDHPLRLVDRDHVGAKLLDDALGELTPAAADLQHAARRDLGDGVERDPTRIALAELHAAVDRGTCGEPVLGRVLAADDVGSARLMPRLSPRPARPCARSHGTAREASRRRRRPARRPRAGSCGQRRGSGRRRHPRRHDVRPERSAARGLLRPPPPRTGTARGEQRLEVALGRGQRNEAAARSQHAGEIGEHHVELLHARQHLVRDDDVEAGVLTWQPHRVGLAEPGGLVDGDDLHGQPARAPLRELAVAGADVEHAARAVLGDRQQRVLARVGAECGRPAAARTRGGRRAGGHRASKSSTAPRGCPRRGLSLVVAQITAGTRGTAPASQGQPLRRSR